MEGGGQPRTLAHRGSGTPIRRHPNRLAVVPQGNAWIWPHPAASLRFRPTGLARRPMCHARQQSDAASCAERAHVRRNIVGLLNRVQDLTWSPSAAAPGNSLRT